MPRAVFMGTPAFAVPCLEALLSVAEVPLVISQPDRRQGRGMKLTPTPVKACAERHGVEVWQPTKVRDGSLEQRLRDLDVEIALVVAYGRILPEGVLSAPHRGCLNVHGSLLPRWRGAAPIQWSVISGDPETGVCLMQMDAGMDTGDVLACMRTPIGPDETSGELAERLSALSGQWLREQLPKFFAGELVPQSQPEQGVTHARMLQKSDGQLCFDATAQQLHDRVRGLSPWPGAYLDTPAGRLKVHRSQPLSGPAVGPPGQVVRSDAEALDIACSDGVLRLLEVQPEGKRRMAAADYLAGHPVSPGARWGEPVRQESG